MDSFMSATEARVHFGEVLERVGRDGAPVIVRRGARPVAVILSFDAYQQLTARAQRTSVYRALDEVCRVREKTAVEMANVTRPSIEAILDEIRQERDDDPSGLR
jgi:prevent-host-death family protein